MRGGLGAVTLAVAYVEQARAFYGRVLGDPPPVAFATDAVWPGARLTFGVADVAAAVAAVRARGCRAADPVDGVADCRDPAGLGFQLGPDMPAPRRIDAVTLYVPDGSAIRSFYAAVVGGGDLDVVVGGGRPGVVVTYATGDLGAATAAVRAAGGTVTDPAAGRSLCTDDQGLSFYLRQH